MKLNQHWVWGGLLLLATVLMLAVVLCRRIPSKDARGSFPQDVARDFVSAVNSNNYALAAGYWRTGDITLLEENFKISFEGFCNQMIQCDSFKVTPIAWQKERSFLVQFEGVHEENRKAFGLYLKQVQGNWKLVRD
jgi:hypothetical protein